MNNLTCFMCGLVLINHEEEGKCIKVIKLYLCSYIIQFHVIIVNAFF